MASNNTKRQVHVSPGIYFSESELSVATKSLGITNLGLAGETLKGPAFQPIEISSWSQFQRFFGGTSTEKYRGSQFPKYELPYIAKTYLEESQNLKVCRVLGLSGVNAGPAWLITAYGDSNSDYTSTNPMVVAVIRSRGTHKKAIQKDTQGECGPEFEFDGIEYFAESVKIEPSSKLTFNKVCDDSKPTSTPNSSIQLTANDYGTFNLVVNGDKTYGVSFNPGEKNYIYNVIGGDPEVGEAEIYVEELYDVALQQLIERQKLTNITCDTSKTGGLVLVDMSMLVPKYKAVNDILDQDESNLKRRDIGKRFLYSQDSLTNGINVHGNPDDLSEEPCKGTVGAIYTVTPYTTEEGTRKYYYVQKKDDDNNLEKLSAPTVEDKIVDECVFVNSFGKFFILQNEGAKAKVNPVTLDMNNYKEQYRFSSTPWIVSELKGDAENVEVTRLFRFHTISDGNNSSIEVKVSIENIQPEYGTFDVLVRDFFDTDASPVILEKYKQCDLVPGSQNYIAARIGSFDESYETKSNYITVEVNETDKTKVSTPCGFLGYPVRNYSGQGITENEIRVQKPFLQYNTNIDSDIRIRKQYFGMSDLVGVDTDLLKYKGVEAYNDDPEYLTPSFHLDSRILEGKPDANDIVTNNNVQQKVMVDGVAGYEWVTVGSGNTVNDYDQEPRIGSEEIMMNTIYEDIRWRKFTVCFYGGFDGWDYYRESRSNSDDFKYQKYRGKINPISGEGTIFSIIPEPEKYGFDKSDKIITSDWYAYLSAIRQFANPKEIDINVFATPGIDYVNQNLLVQEVIEMIEEERADSIYVITTPDKPYGYGDTKYEMYTAEDAVDNLEDSEIDSNWACTYFPWVKYYDSTLNQYIYLPPTKDVVKNFAYTDNVAYPWYAAAGWNRGLSDGIRSKKNLVLAEQDELYDGRINFINSFADEGIRIWGDKNLQIAETHAHMNRISKRRCLIRLRKLISIACIGLLFDPNDATTIQSFKSAVQPILEDFISKRALTDAKLVVDDSEESRDRLEINAQIYLKFMPNLEYINIGLVATPQGVSFEDI